MRRQLRTPVQMVRGTVTTVAIPKTRRAFLLANYPAAISQGNPSNVLVTFTDPIHGTQGMVVAAYVRAGMGAPAVRAGTPVLVQFNHGRAEIVSFG